MKLRDYELGEKPLKLLQDRTLFKNERCVVDASKDTIALPITLDEKTEGYIFHGVGKLLLDTIIETSRGAVGKPIERDLQMPFLMIGETEQITESLGQADSRDLSKLGYESPEAFSKKAEELLRSLFARRYSSIDLDGKEASIFAFENANAKPDVLVTKEDRLVYTSRRNVFVFKGDKGVLKRPGEILVSRKGRAIVIDTRHFMMEE